MKFWIEQERDAFVYFPWFSKEIASEIIEYVPKISIFSINGIRVYRIDEKNIFCEVCSDVIKRLFKEDNELRRFKFRLFANVEVGHYSPRIEKYYRLWRRLEKKYNLDGFVKYPEIEVNLGTTVFYSSFAEFSIDNILNALRIVSGNSYKMTIVAVNMDDVITDKDIEETVRFAFEENNTMIDYFKLSLKLCAKNQIVFRWGDSSEDVALGLICPEKMFDLFNPNWQFIPHPL